MANVVAKPKPAATHKRVHPRQSDNARGVLTEDTPVPTEASVPSRQPDFSEPMVITVKELARVLGCGLAQAYDLIRSGRIKSVRVGRTIRIPKSAVTQFLEEGK